MSMWPLCRKIVGLLWCISLWHQITIKSAEAAEASCFSELWWPVERPRGIPTVTLFVWPFTWQEETGRQRSRVFVEITESLSILAAELSDTTRDFKSSSPGAGVNNPPVALAKWLWILINRSARSSVWTALMMLNNILDYWLFLVRSRTCHSWREDSKTALTQRTPLGLLLGSAFFLQ